MKEVNGLMKSEKLINFFESFLTPTLDGVVNEFGSATRGNIILRQDNDLKHKSKFAQNLLKIG